MPGLRVAENASLGFAVPASGAQGSCVYSGQRTRGGVKVVDQHTVETEIRHVRETIARGEPDPVRVRAFLALFVGADGTRVRHERGVFAEFSVPEDGEDSDVARGVVGDENVFAGLIEGDVARIFAERGKLVQQGKLSALGIESKRADGALFAGLIDGIHEFPVGVNFKPGRITRFRSESLRGQFACLCVEFVR